MPTIHFDVRSQLPPGTVLGALVDFNATRAEVWPNIDEQHFKVHGQGPGWAEVTEGSSVAGGVWERERYSWDATTGTVGVETLDSNTWGPGSRWDYIVTGDPGGGSRVEVTAVRKGIGLRGRLIGALLVFGGRPMLRSQMERALARVRPA